MLFLNYSTTINWRYFLTGLPGLAPLVGDYFLRIQTKRFGTEQRGFVSAIIGIALVAFFMGVLIQPKSNEYFNRLAQAKTYDAQLRLCRVTLSSFRGANRRRAVLAGHRSGRVGLDWRRRWLAPGTTRIKDR
jgi:hypothetical protein